MSEISPYYILLMLSAYSTNCFRQNSLKFIIPKVRDPLQFLSTNTLYYGILGTCDDFTMWNGVVLEFISKNLYTYIC